MRRNNRNSHEIIGVPFFLDDRLRSRAENDSAGAVLV
jgi:hypothetical protein